MRRKPSHDRVRGSGAKLLRYNLAGAVREPLRPIYGIALRAFRIVASTISAARALGGWLPVDMIWSIFAKASSCFRRNAESPSTSRNACDSFSGVKSSCGNSGTTFSPITRLARMTDCTLMARHMIQASAAPRLAENNA